MKRGIHITRSSWQADMPSNILRISQFLTLLATPSSNIMLMSHWIYWRTRPITQPRMTSQPNLKSLKMSKIVHRRHSLPANVEWMQLGRSQVATMIREEGLVPPNRGDLLRENRLNDQCDSVQRIQTLRKCTFQRHLAMKSTAREVREKDCHLV